MGELIHVASIMMDLIENAAQWKIRSKQEDLSVDICISPRVLATRLEQYVIHHPSLLQSPSHRPSHNTSFITISFIISFIISF